MPTEAEFNRVLAYAKRDAFDEGLKIAIAVAERKMQMAIHIIERTSPDSNQDLSTWRASLSTAKEIREECIAKLGSFT